MTTIEIKSTMPLTELLDSLKQLGIDELGEVAATAVRLRASRRANVLPEREALLLEKINRTLTTAEQERMALLIEKRQAETLTETELAELINLSDLVEEIQVERLSALIELAAVRNISLDALKQSINYTPAS
ncbi:MAG: hypothetical protein H6658_13065 [Ardenticatenaceae bacterium]|nr:hypothetical protein [Ardenticatenaceae bacterium]